MLRRGFRDALRSRPLVMQALTVMTVQPYMQLRDCIKSAPRHTRPTGLTFQGTYNLLPASHSALSLSTDTAPVHGLVHFTGIG